MAATQWREIECFPSIKILKDLVDLGPRVLYTDDEGDPLMVTDSMPDGLRLALRMGAPGA